MRRKSDFWGIIVGACLILVPVTTLGADKLVVKDGGGATKFVVTDTGTTAIGTAVPESTLTVVGPTFPAAKVRREVAFTGGGRGVAAYELKSTGDMLDGFGPSFEFWISDNTYTASMAVASMEALRDGADNSGKWILRTANAGTLGARLAVTKAGYVGVGLAAPTHLLHVSGGAYTDGGQWVDGSSRDYKENIQPLTSETAVDTVMKLEPVTFAYKTNKGEGHVGFIAEDVPDLVATKDRKGLSPMDIVAVLTKTVQDQQKTIEQLNEKLNSLEYALNALSGRNMVSSAQ